VHFATHGFISGAHPEVSGIVLSLIDEKRQGARQALVRAILLGWIYRQGEPR